MKYFIDFEFLEGNVPCQIKGFSIPRWLIKPNNTIQPISVGICSSDGREYYAISKDFNLKEAWNRYDIKTMTNLKGDSDSNKMKVYWIRDNVLKPIWEEKCKEGFSFKNSPMTPYGIESLFTYSNFKRLLNKYGKTNKQIAEEVVKFTKPVQNIDKNIPDPIQTPEQFKIDYSKPQFYGYYCDYDWVVFCWLFGKMIDLPTGFPELCIDLKQILDEKAKILYNTPESYCSYYTPSDKLVKHVQYPKQTNEHNALADARFNRDLFNFLNTI